MTKHFLLNGLDLYGFVVQIWQIVSDAVKGFLDDLGSMSKFMSKTRYVEYYKVAHYLVFLNQNK